MNIIQIERALRELRLSGIAESPIPTRVMHRLRLPSSPSWRPSPPCCRDELDRRRSGLTERRFNARAWMSGSRWLTSTGVSTPKLPRSACFELHTLKFIGEGANAR